LGYAAARLAIEYESDFHRTDRRQWNMDIDRENALEHEGWALIRVTSRTDRRMLVRQIRSHLEHAGLSLCRSAPDPGPRGWASNPADLRTPRVGIEPGTGAAQIAPAHEHFVVTAPRRIRLFGRCASVR